MGACPWMGFQVCIVVQDANSPEKQKRGGRSPKSILTSPRLHMELWGGLCRGPGAEEGHSHHQRGLRGPLLRHKGNSWEGSLDVLSATGERHLTPLSSTWEEGITVANQLTLRWSGNVGCLGQVRCNPNGPSPWKEEGRRVRVRSEVA